MIKSSRTSSTGSTPMASTYCPTGLRSASAQKRCLTSSCSAGAESRRTARGLLKFNNFFKTNASGFQLTKTMSAKCWVLCKEKLLNWNTGSYLTASTCCPTGLRSASARKRCLASSRSAGAESRRTSRGLLKFNNFFKTNASGFQLTKTMSAKCWV